jgi:enoyl-CoA hydratase/carnithine racemase
MSTAGWSELTVTSLEIDPDGVALIMLRRPEAANSRNQPMRDELTRIYTALARDPDVKVVVLTGEGDRFFCAGMDLKEAATVTSIARRREMTRAARDTELLANLPQPTIAAVNGYALGGGCEMALACDIRVASETASMGLPEIVHGLIPGGGGTQRLPRIVGQAKAYELIYFSKRLSAAEALAIGLVHRCVPGPELAETVHAMATELAGRSTRALRTAKELIRRSFEVPQSIGVDLELDANHFLLEDFVKASEPADGSGSS